MSNVRPELRALFVKVLEVALKVESFKPNEKELDLIEQGFYGMFKTRGNGLLSQPKSWTGFVRRDGTIDEPSRLQCLQSAFGRMCYYHLGRSSAYLGTIINATENLGSIAEGFGLCPHVIPKDLWKLDWESQEYKSWEPAKKENREIQRKFADHCDTFCQVFTLIVKKGKTSSVAGDAWRKALGYES